MSHVDKSRQAGFTIIELMLAMAFVAVLLVSVALTTMQIMSIYNRGATLRAVDQAGRVVTQDIQKTLASSQPIDVGTGQFGGLNYKVQVQLGGEQSNPDGGRLCTGTYSYVWNTGRGLINPVNRYDTGQALIRLVKVHDVGGLYCADVTASIKMTDAVELLSSGDRELAIQSFKIDQVANDTTTSQALYFISLELGTNDQSALSQAVTLNTIDTACRPPSDQQSLIDFCAINKFEFTARTGNRRAS